MLFYQIKCSKFFTFVTNNAETQIYGIIYEISLKMCPKWSHRRDLNIDRAFKPNFFKGNRKKRLHSLPECCEFVSFWLLRIFLRFLSLKNFTQLDEQRKRNFRFIVKIFSFSFFSLPQEAAACGDSKSRLPTSTIPTISTVSKHFWARVENPRHDGLEGTFFEPRKSQYHHCKITVSPLQNHSVTIAKSQYHHCTPNQHSQLEGCHSQLGMASIREFNGVKGITFFSQLEVFNLLFSL